MFLKKKYFRCFYSSFRIKRVIAKTDETFFVYPTVEALEADASAGHKRVWDRRAFSAESGDIVIVNGAAEEMYRFEISERSEAFF